MTKRQIIVLENYKEFRNIIWIPGQIYKLEAPWGSRKNHPNFEYIFVKNYNNAGNIDITEYFNLLSSNDRQNVIWEINETNRTASSVFAKQYKPIKWYQLKLLPVIHRKIGTVSKGYSFY